MWSLRDLQNLGLIFSRFLVKLLKIGQTGDSEGFYFSQDSFFGEIYLIRFYVRRWKKKTHFQKIWKKEKKKKKNQPAHHNFFRVYSFIVS